MFHCLVALVGNIGKSDFFSSCLGNKSVSAVPSERKEFLFRV